MKAIITVYKDTGKFYESAKVDLPDDLREFQAVRTAQIIQQHVPLLDGGFVQVRLAGSEVNNPEARFFNRLYEVSFLKNLLQEGKE